MSKDVYIESNIHVVQLLERGICLFAFHSTIQFEAPAGIRVLIFVGMTDATW
jgi:hypothetical protein